MEAVRDPVRSRMLRRFDRLLNSPLITATYRPLARDAPHQSASFTILDAITRESM